MLPSRDDIVLQTLLPCGPMRKRASVNHRCRAACSMRTFHKPHGERPRQTGRRTSAWKRPRGGPLDSPKWLLLTRTAPSRPRRASSLVPRGVSQTLGLCSYLWLRPVLGRLAPASPWETGSGQSLGDLLRPVLGRLAPASARLCSGQSLGDLLRSVGCRLGLPQDTPQRTERSSPRTPRASLRTLRAPPDAPDSPQDPPPKASQDSLNPPRATQAPKWFEPKWLEPKWLEPKWLEPMIPARGPQTSRYMDDLCVSLIVNRCLARGTC